MTSAPEKWPVGVFDEVPEHEYHVRRLGVASKSGLDQLARSPLHYKNWVETPDSSSTPALAFGSAVHMAILEPSRFANAYAVEPDFGDCRYANNKLKRDNWRADNGGKLTIAATDHAAILGIQKSLCAHPLLGRALETGKKEVTLYWTDKETGVRCKGRVDLWMEDLVLPFDAKSTEDASLRGFTKSVANYTYHSQAGLYLDGLQALGFDAKRFIFVVFEKRQPYAVAMYSLDDDALASARARNRRLLQRMSNCIAANSWPGYAETIQTITLPIWAREEA